MIEVFFLDGVPNNAYCSPSFTCCSIASGCQFFLRKSSPVALITIELTYDPQCDALTETLPNEVFSPETGNTTTNGTIYDLLNNARWSKTSVLAPGCVFRPASAEHVSQGLKVLVNRSCPFAIKAGGHNPIPGSNNIDGGVSVDVGLLNHTSLSADRTFVSLGSGVRWGQAYDTFVESEGILFPGGLCGQTGVGGVLLGGGESYLQPRVGWGVDSVLNYEIVLASGEIVNANQTSNKDLFRALKGGGSNFGIVTRADVSVVKQGDIWAGQIISPGIPQTLEATLQATTNFTAQNNLNPNVGAQVVITFSNGTATIISSIASTDGTVNPEVLQGFTAVQPQIANTVKTRSLSNVVHELDSNQADGYR